MGNVQSKNLSRRTNTMSFRNEKAIRCYHFRNGLTWTMLIRSSHRWLEISTCDLFRGIGKFQESKTNQLQTHCHQNSRKYRTAPRQTTRRFCTLYLPKTVLSAKAAHEDFLIQKGNKTAREPWNESRDRETSEGTRQLAQETSY